MWATVSCWSKLVPASPLLCALHVTFQAAGLKPLHRSDPLEDDTAGGSEDAVAGGRQGRSTRTSRAAAARYAIPRWHRSALAGLWATTCLAGTLPLCLQTRQQQSHDPGLATTDAASSSQSLSRPRLSCFQRCATGLRRSLSCRRRHLPMAGVGTCGAGALAVSRWSTNWLA